MKKLMSPILAATLALVLAAPFWAAASSDGKEILDLTNAQRKSAGLAALAWDEDLAEAAEIRAKEIARKYTEDHTRPDGGTFFSVSTKVWGENTSYGYDSASEAMAAWVKSQGHKNNMLDQRFTIMGAACAKGGDGTLYWAQEFGTGKSNASWAGVKSYTLDPFAGGAQSSGGAPAAATVLVRGDGAVNVDALAAQVKQSATTAKFAAVQIKSAASISPAALAAAATAGGGKAVVLYADTLNASGKAVQGRLTLEPAKLTGRKTDIALAVTADKASIAGVKAAAESRYGGAAAYLHMGHKGSLTVPTQVTAKVNLAGLDTGNLRFYLYDGNAFTAIAEPDYSIDDTGYLSLFTETGGDILITDQAI